MADTQTDTQTDAQKDTQKIFTATGRRKEAVARIRLFIEGKGKFVINGRKFDNYFVTIDQRMQIKKPIIVSDLDGKIDIYANVCGGGLSGQAGAVSLGIARALLSWNPESKGLLRKENLLTRDPRAKERKKYGRRGARRRCQWTKR
jgi:small subunit ribosomal protein S9